jgi:UDP-N-acetylglucosamine acyltransferase
MSPVVSRFADVDPRAELGDDTFVGPFCVVGPHAKLGAGCRLDSHVAIVGHTTVGKNNRFFPGAVIGADPQDLGYTGADTRTEIGDGNTFREGVTIHRGAEKEDGITRIGNNNLFMANSHVGHNGWIHNNVVMANGSLLAGHVHVHDFVTISGNCLVHHFATLGTLAFMAGGSSARTDVPPYMMVVGNEHPRFFNINIVGMKRRGVSPAAIDAVKRAHRLLYREMKNVGEVRAFFSETLAGPFPHELTLLLDFVDTAVNGKKGRAGEARRTPAPAAPSTTPAEGAPETTPVRRAA